MQEKKDKEVLLGDWNDPDAITKFKGSDTHKFLNRNRTINSNWLRTHTYAKETLLSDKKMNILDVGCGNGATMEIFRYYGHSVTGMDYSPDLSHDNDWIYSPLLKSQGLDCIVHSGSTFPYPFEDKSFDLVICWGAITFFKPYDIWPKVLGEFERLSRGAILVGVNVGSVFEKNKKHLDDWRSKEFRRVKVDNSRHIYKWRTK